MDRIVGTPEHPFFTERGQVPMGQLGIGTAIITRAGPGAPGGGARLVVKSVRTVARPEGVPVYNFTVDGTHTYYVGTANGGIWVHNADCNATGAVGEKLTADRLRASGYDEVFSLKAGGRDGGIDAVALKRSSSGDIERVLFVEVKSSVNGQAKNLLFLENRRLDLNFPNF